MILPSDEMTDCCSTATPSPYETMHCSEYSYPRSASDEGKPWNDPKYARNTERCQVLASCLHDVG